MNFAPLGLAGTKSAGPELVTAEITEQRWLALARTLIVAGQPAAENPLDPDMPPGREEGISEVVAGKLAGLGLAVEMISKRAGRPRADDVMFLPEFNQIKRHCFEHIRRESTHAFA